MRSPRSTGRIIGLLLLLHLATGLTVPYILLQRITTADFLASAAGNSFKVRLAVLLLFLGGAIPVGIVVATWRFFREYSYAMLLWLFALAVVNLSVQAFENANWMSMLSLSQEYASAGAANAGVFQTLGGAVRAAWKWSHYTHLLVVVCWIFLLCGMLYRFALVPRALAAIGMVAALLQISGITLPQFVGYTVRFPVLFGVPLGIIYLALSLWLITKGFESDRPTRVEGAGIELPA